MRNEAEIKSFGIHLRKLREEREYSQQQLADIADIAKITIQRIENAKFTVTLDVMVSLSKALKLPLKELTDFKTKKH